MNPLPPDCPTDLRVRLLFVSEAVFASMPPAFSFASRRMGDRLGDLSAGAAAIKLFFLDLEREELCERVSAMCRVRWRLALPGGVLLLSLPGSKEIIDSESVCGGGRRD